MTLGTLTAMLQANDRILVSLRRATPDLVLARLAEIADDEKALKQLHSNLEMLARMTVAARNLGVTVHLGGEK